MCVCVCVCVYVCVSISVSLYPVSCQLCLQPNCSSSHAPTPKETSLRIKTEQSNIKTLCI